MAKPQDSYPETATNEARKRATNGDGEAVLREALAAHGEEIAEAVERTDELDDALETAILMAATADDEEVEHLTDSASHLVEAADGLTTEEMVTLATEVGDSADDLGDALETVLELQQTGNLDDLVRIASAFSESLSPDEVEELATMLEDDGTEIVEALDAVLELQRADQLDELVDLASTLSSLDIDEDTAAGLNTVLGAVGEAQRYSEPRGLFGMASELGSRDARTGLGYFIAVLKALGRRLRSR